MADFAEHYPTVLAEARSWGLRRGVLVGEDTRCTAGELVGDAIEKGLLPVAAGPSVVQFVPPLVVKEEKVDDALSKFKKAIA